MKVKLAEALLRRKELQQKVHMLNQIKVSDLYEVKVKRVNVTESIDNITAQVPKLQAGQVTREHDWHSRQLRRVDAAIQQANWTTEVDVPEDTMSDYKEDQD